MLLTARRFFFVGRGRPLNIIGHYRNPQRALPCAKVRHASRDSLKYVQLFLLQATARKTEPNGKGRYTKGHKNVIFHVSFEKLPVNRF